MIWRPPCRAATAARRLDPRQHDLVDVQEAVLLQADVDERGLQAGEDVVDPALVDVADDRAGAAALQIELGDVVSAAGLGAARGAVRRWRVAVCGDGVPVASEQRDPGLAAVDADQHLLLQFVVL